MKRSECIQLLSQMILQINSTHPLRVAIDGVDAVGKTTLADELYAELVPTGRQVIRASVDSFHNPEHIRRKRGSLSPEGFYYDSYNYDALEACLLIPLGPKGNRQYQTAVFDLQLDQPIQSPTRTAAQDAILLFDGIFLLRPRLITFWDLTIYLHADFSHTATRGIQRDSDLYGSADDAAIRYERRYIPGQKYYHQQVEPLDKADIIIDNSDLETPNFLKVPRGLWSVL